MEKLIAKYTINQLAAFGVGGVVIVVLGLGIWYLIRQCRSKDAIIAQKDSQLLTLMDRYAELSKNSRESLQPVLSSMNGVRDAMQEVRTIIRERMPRQGD